jgi:hypothetical protein
MMVGKPLVRPHQLKDWRDRKDRETSDYTIRFKKINSISNESVDRKMLLLIQANLHI